MRVPHVSDPATHAGSEVAAGRPEDHHSAAGHVLAAVVADALDYGASTAIAHRESFGGASPEECVAARGAVKSHVSNNDVIFRGKGRFGRRINNQSSAGQALADV